MKTCKDLVYMMTLSNLTDTPILFKVKLRQLDPTEVVNLRWPVNGIRGTIGANSVATVALFQKIHPTEGVAGEKAELEKLDIQLICKTKQEEAKAPDAAENANVSSGDAKQGPASSVDNSGTTNTGGVGEGGGTGASIDP